MKKSLIFFHQSFLDGLNFGDDDWKTNDVIVERGNDLLQLSFDVDGLNRNARTPELANREIFVPFYTFKKDFTLLLNDFLLVTLCVSPSYKV